MPNPILTASGRITIADSISRRPLHIAWGTGDGAWVSAPSENPTATALLNEVGRRTVTQCLFVVPDSAGSIDTGSGKLSPSPGNAPTNNLYVKANFDFADASGSVIREAAVFVGTQVAAGLPGGQQYFTPGQITDPGILLQIENFVPIFRSPAIQENFEYVITF